MKILTREEFEGQVAQLQKFTRSMHAESQRKWEESGGHKRSKVFGEAVVAICTEDDSTAEVVPLSKAYGLSIINRVHSDGKTEGIVSCSPFAFVDGRVVCGTLDLRVHAQDRFKFGLATQGLTPESDWRLAGNLRSDVAKPTDETNSNVAFKFTRRWDHKLVKWSLWAFEQVQGQKARQAGGFISPPVLFRVPEDNIHWLQLREGPELEERLVAIVNNKFYQVEGVVNQVSDDSHVRFNPTTDGEYAVKSHTESCNWTLFNPSHAFREAVLKTFGKPCSLTFLPINTTERTVAYGESLFTSIEQQAKEPGHVFTIEELKALPQYQELLCLAVLTSVQYFDGEGYIDGNLAYTRQTPFVHLPPAYPRVQNVDGKKESFVAQESGLSIDLLNVPHRMAARHGHAPGARPLPTEAEKDFLSPAERMLFALTPPVGRTSNDLFSLARQRSSFKRVEIDQALESLVQRNRLKRTGNRYVLVTAGK